jgi:hypothetical protein
VELPFLSTNIQTEATSLDPRRQWHRLFGLLLTDHLVGSPFTVELEKDLSQKQQLLDVAIVRRGSGAMTRPLPDGLTDLVSHNLITFKSHQESLNDWSLKELTGHYVNYRKQVSDRGALVAEDQFRLYAVCARYPRDLFAAVAPEPVQPGVYTCRRGSDAIRIVVAADLPKEERNALLHLFSAAPDRVEYGAEHYRMQSADTSTIVKELFGEYRIEGLSMPYTMKDFHRDVARKYLRELTPEERLAGLAVEDRLAGLAVEDRLAGLAVEERLAGLPAKEIAAYLKQIRNKSVPAQRKKRKPRRRSANDN